MNQPNPLAGMWRELTALALVNSAFVLLVARLLFDDQVVKSLRRSRANVIELLNEWFNVRNQAIDEALSTIDTHEDRMHAFESSLLAQGESLNRALDEHQRRQTKALETITGTLGAIQKEASATAIAVARIQGVVESGVWNGVERRSRDRRD
jgi:hypothetical protein